MDIKNVFPLYRMMNHQHFMMSYNGHISHQSVMGLLAIAEKKLDQEENDNIVRKKVFNVMIECLQSVCRSDSEHSDSVFMLGKDESNYTLYSCFYCSDAYRQKLTHFLDAMINWSPERLREERRLLLTDESDNPDLSSFFSLIDITVKSKNNISYDFQEDGSRYFFVLKTNIQHAFLS